MTAVGILAGWTADQLLGDPRRFHPVAGFGQLAQHLETKLYADSRLNGVAFEIVLVGGTAALGWALEGLTSKNRLANTAVFAVATWTVLGGRSLLREGEAIADQLSAGDLAAAREQITHLCSRDPATLSGPDLARACVESLAENTSDAVVAPLFWGAVAGVPGLLAYRAINTLDAMVGYRNERYTHFGWAAARVDDIANWLPARLSAALTIASAPLVGGSSAEAWRTVRRDAAKHPSPNAGQVESAFAGALGVRLGGANSYGGEVEDRGTLGDGRPVSEADVARTNKLSLLVGAGTAVLAAAVRWRRGQGRPSRADATARWGIQPKG